MYVISYDIASDRIRNKTAQVLLEYGKRIQYSVFECDISGNRFKTLYAKLCEMGIEQEDYHIRFYHICENCMKKTRVIGGKENEKYNRDEVIII